MISADRVPTACRGAAACLVLCLLTACRAAEVPGVLELRGPTMGTTWSVKLVPGPGGLATADVEAIDREIRLQLTAIEGLMSTWDPDSELSRFNQYREREPFQVSPDTFAVFKWAVSLAGETGGALDVTVLPIVHAWGFGASGDAAGPVPEAATLARLLESTGVRHLELDPGGQWVRKHRPELECDFSALAPGYAADRLAERLDRRGLAGFLIDVGGEFVARGRGADGSPWRIAVERPAATRGPAARVVLLEDVAIATSGDYRNFREVNGVRLSHLIDPRTAYPVRHQLASVTVVEASCLRADALATAIMVLGPDEGMALARRLDLAVLLLVRNDHAGFDERTTPRFDALTRPS
ncbi:MAG: FAD:protein FMN transferase [Acidobacteriota bacterium]|nr:FAD:protein FMN transferase [Acidobacteriota bacterium]